MTGNQIIVMIVDDDDSIRRAVRRLMKSYGVAVETFASAEEFLDSPHRDRVACLILDVRLPGMSGIELQRRLLDAACLTPVIFVTAHGDESLRNLVMQAGAAGFLNKPVRSDALLKEIRAVLERVAN